jgi:hypothetical protein
MTQHQLKAYKAGSLLQQIPRRCRFVYPSTFIIWLMHALCNAYAGSERSDEWYLHIKCNSTTWIPYID